MEEASKDTREASTSFFICAVLSGILAHNQNLRCSILLPVQRDGSPGAPAGSFRRHDQQELRRCWNLPASLSTRGERRHQPPHANMLGYYARLLGLSIMAIQ